MNNRRFTLNERECAELQVAYHNSEDGQTRLRFQAVRLYGTGHRVDEIVALCGCLRTSLLTWCQTYRNEGITGLLDHRKGGNNAKLTAVQIETLRHWLHTYTPAQILGPDHSTGDGAFWTVPGAPFTPVWRRLALRHTAAGRVSLPGTRAVKVWTCIGDVWRKAMVEGTAIGD